MQTRSVVVVPTDKADVDGCRIVTSLNLRLPRIDETKFGIVHSMRNKLYDCD